MKPGNLLIVSRSVMFYKKPVLYQILIIALLSAVITGSLLTGRSVKTSLRKSAFERLGNTGILISSGLRFVDASLADRMRDSSGISCAGILEVTSYCQSLISQKGTPDTHIYAVSNDFFKFQGNDSINIRKGELAINDKLAGFLGVIPGDELILRFNNLSDIPADAPFSPSKGTGNSVVMKVGTILKSSDGGNFSLSISQILPMNIFMNLSDLPGTNGKSKKINRILVNYKNGFSTVEMHDRLKQIIKPSDIGLNLRLVKKTGEYELISDRVFIDEAVISVTEKTLPLSAPVITYLGNRVSAGIRSTPYSFVSALPSSLYPEIARGDEIIINRWLADDLVVIEGDTIEMSWYSPDSLNKLTERSNKFVINRIVDMNGIWSDSLLMPDFPGISGSKTCSGWDAGVLIKTDEIRDKDEDYWNKFRGTPKAFINYEKGKEIWGNNFGAATSVRFPKGISLGEIDDKLTGVFKPDESGLTITDLAGDSVKAANESIDFGTLFLSLGFFLILSSLILLSLSVASYFDTKKDQIKILFALGFKNRRIAKLLFLESVMIAMTGSLIGVFAGCIVNILITMALNSVWSGAVQTNTLKVFVNMIPIWTGFAITILATTVFMTIKIKRYLRKLNRKEKEIPVRSSRRINFILLLSSSLIVITLFVLSVLFQNQELFFCFCSGTVLLLALVLFWRTYFIGWKYPNYEDNKNVRSLSNLFYSFYPSHAVTPILFIAAGIFSVFITGANRMNLDGRHIKRSGGTGGYILWCETTVPVKDDLNSLSGKKSFGLDDGQFVEMGYVQAKRSSGDDASCLNLNHVKAPPLLGINPSDFMNKGSFSFSKVLSGKKLENTWQFLNVASDNNTIYGIADQTVLQWGLKIKPGDTLILRAENGQPLHIIVAAGLKSSVFQGYVLIGINNFMKYYPSVAGSSVILVDGKPEQAGLYKSALNERFENYGITTELTTDRLASFYEVTNTYISVFGFFGALGMITGIAGLGFVLLRNYNYRKREFALMLATGFRIEKIRRMILSEQILILFAGVSSGVLSALLATLPSIKSSPDVPWLFLLTMVFTIAVTGLTVLFISVKSVTKDSLVASLKKE